MSILYTVQIMVIVRIQGIYFIRCKFITIQVTIRFRNWCSLLQIRTQKRLACNPVVIWSLPVSRVEEPIKLREPVECFTLLSNVLCTISTQSFIHLFVHFFRSFIFPFIHSLIRSFIHWFIRSFIRSLIHSFIRSFSVHSFFIH